MRILLGDDHDMVRDALSLFLQSEGSVGTVAVRSLEEAVASVERGERFDLVLLDYKMPGMNGLDGIARIKAVAPDTPVAILSGIAPPSVANAAIAAGAAGFLPKTIGAKSMVSAIRFMVAGETYLPVGLTQQTQDQRVADLTRRETDVLRGICEGKSNKEIALDLSLQEVTIKLHVKTLCRKLDARNRTQAAMIARDRHLV